MIGRTLTHYSVLRKLGEGGMGEVYLADDTTLDRQVAIKVLSSERAEDAHGIKRLMREARAAATLDHPNICAIYEVAEAEGQHFIVMQYVPGETLAARLAGGRLALKDALAVAIQVTDALAVAHARGIVHRDIKPQNIMITPRGQVKLLDFGVATLAPAFAAGEAATESLLTVPGAVLGTVKYMSPEQAQGQPLDARSDIFSVGVVLYEMASGRHPFAGDNHAATISAIILGAPEPVAQVVPETPAELDRILTKALAKNRAERYQAIQELLIDLQALARDLERDAPPRRTTVPARAATGRRRWPPYLIAATAVVVAAAAGLGWYQFSGGDRGPSLKDATFTQLTDQPGPEAWPSLAPDGKQLVYASLASGNWDVYLQRVGGKTALNLTMNSPAADTHPAFSPDGEWIAFHSERDGGGIRVMGATGESDRKVADAGYNPAWSPDGQEIVYATKGFLRQEYRTGGGSQLFAVNVSTGDTRLLSKQAPDAVQPSWSPHGQRIAYWAREGARRDIWTMSVQSGEPRRVTDDAFGDWSPTWSPDGRWLYFASDRAGSMNLWRVAIDEPSGKLLGPPEAVPTPSPYSGPISLSKDGKRIAYVQQVSTTSFQKVAFNPVTETTVGPPISVTQLSRELYLPDVTRDNGWLAFSSIGNPEDIFIVRTDGTELSQLTDDATMDRAPVFSPDGTRIAFIRQGTGHGYFEVWVMNRDGSGRRQLTFTSDKVASVPVWSPDGARLAYPFDAPDYPAFIVEVGKGWAEQTPTPLPLMNAADGSRFMIRSWSPDGTRLAGERRLVSAAVGIVTYSFASGTYEQLTESGWYPCWLNDSSRLLFQDEGRIFLVDSRTRKVHEVLSVAPREVSPYRFAISGDNRWIYFGITVTEADVWVVDLH